MDYNAVVADQINHSQVRAVTLQSWGYHVDHTSVDKIRAGKCIRPVRNAWTGGYVRCRKCVPCLAARKAQWVHRMEREGGKVARAWFVTLTFRDAASACYAEAQKWLKRVRSLGHSLRYVCTEEFGGKHGRWHLHLIVYSDSIRWRDLCHRWSAGFSTAKLVRTAGAYRYVAKYLTKTAGRIRASLLFGKEREAQNESSEGKEGGVFLPSPGGIERISLQGETRKGVDQKEENARRGPICPALAFRKYLGGQGFVGYGTETQIIRIQGVPSENRYDSRDRTEGGHDSRRVEVYFEEAIAHWVRALRAEGEGGEGGSGGCPF